MVSQQRLLFIGEDLPQLLKEHRGVFTALTSSGFSLAVASSMGQFSKEQAELLGIRVYSLPRFGRLWNFWRYISRMVAIAQICRAERPSGIWSLDGDLFAAWIARCFKVRLTIVFPDLNFSYHGLGLRACLAALRLRVLCFAATSFWFASQEDCSYCLERGWVSKQQIQLLPGLGLALQHYPYAPQRNSDQVRFLWLGSEDADIQAWLLATQQLQAHDVNMRFQMITTKTVSVVDKEIAAWQQQGVGEFLGTGIDPRPFLIEADAVIVSRQSAHVLEAAAMGCALLHGKAAACHWFEDGMHGLAYRVGSSEDLVFTLERFYRFSAAKRLAMGNAGRKAIEKYINLDKLVLLYSRALQQ
jgi:hypothetical protein